MGVFTSSRSQIVRNRRRRVRALNSSLRAATSAVTPLAIWASNRISSSLSRGSSVPRRASVACSTPSSLVRGDDRGDAAVCCIGTGRPRSVRAWLRGEGVGRPTTADGFARIEIERGAGTSPGRGWLLTWPMSADGPVAWRAAGTPGNHSLVGPPKTAAAPGVRSAPRPGSDTRRTPLTRTAETPPLTGWGTSCPEWVMTEPLPPIPSRPIPRPFGFDDRESFQGALRHGTLGGQIWTVKRTKVTMRVHIGTPW